MTRFCIDDWIEYHMADLQPIVAMRGQQMNAEEAYDMIMENIGINANEELSVIISRRNAVFGENCVIATPELYNTLSVQRELGYTLQEWDNLSRYNKGLLIAHYRLHNIVESINAYMRWEASNKRKAAKDNNIKQTPTRRPRKKRG